jgi:hypothetical protein
VWAELSDAKDPFDAVLENNWKVEIEATSFARFIASYYGVLDTGSKGG